MNAEPLAVYQSQHNGGMKANLHCDDPIFRCDSCGRGMYISLDPHLCSNCGAEMYDVKIVFPDVVHVGGWKLVRRELLPPDFAPVPFPDAASHKNKVR